MPSHSCRTPLAYGIFGSPVRLPRVQPRPTRLNTGSRDSIKESAYLQTLSGWTAGYCSSSSTFTLTIDRIKVLRIVLSTPVMSRRPCTERSVPSNAPSLVARYSLLRFLCKLSVLHSTFRRTARRELEISNEGGTAMLGCYLQTEVLFTTGQF